MDMNVKIAVFISGKGSNARKLQEFFASDEFIQVVLILSEKENPMLESWCIEKSVLFLVIDPGNASNPEYLDAICLKNEIQWIVLAGYLKKIPEKLLLAFPNRIINIHPSLLPKFGGKGMYGDFVHKAVLDAKEKKSGITIHLVNEEYDKGEVLAQYNFKLDSSESIESLRTKIQLTEHLYFPKVVRDFIMKNAIIKK
jgi:phosphoribosylglycinamide formyltransferase-1